MGNRKSSPTPRQRAHRMADAEWQEAVNVALRRQAARATLTADEKRLVKEYEAVQRWKLYIAIPPGDFRELAGRHPRILQDWHRNYGCPIPPRKPVDLEAWFKWFGDEVAPRIGKLFADGPTLDERARELALERERFKLERERNEWIPRADLHELFSTIAGSWRRVQEQLQRQFGREAHLMVDEMLEGMEAKFRRTEGDP